MMLFGSTRQFLSRTNQGIAGVRESVQRHPLTDRFKRSLAGRVLQNYLEDDVDGLAGMLAYNTLFSLMPILAAASFTIGILVRNFKLREEISDAFTEELPPSLADPFVETIDTAATQVEGLGLITLILLLYGGSRLYSALDRAFAIVYRSRRRNYFERKIFALLIAPALAIVFVTSTVVSATATGIFTTSLGKYINLDPNVQEFVSVYLIAFLLGSVMSWISYATIPVDGSGWRGSIVGALAAGFLFVLLSQLYPIYIGLTAGTNAYGAAYGLILLFMFWLYLAAQIIVIGAEISAETSGARKRNQTEYQLNADSEAWEPSRGLTEMDSEREDPMIGVSTQGGDRGDRDGGE